MIEQTQPLTSSFGVDEFRKLAAMITQESS